MYNSVKMVTITLDLIDKKILSELDKNCRIPNSILAKRVKKSRETVKYRIHQLQSKGIITSFNASFNPHKLGYKIFKIYLKLRNLPEQKKKLFKTLESSGRIYWMGEFSGRWDLIFGIFAKNDYEFFELKNKIISEFSNIIVEEAGGILLDVKQYPKMYFTNQISPPVTFAGEINHPDLDPIDYKILGIVVNNGRIPITKLAKKTGTTPSIANSRLKKLKELGIIIQYRIGVDLNKLGLELYKAIIRLDRYTKEDEKRLLAYISNLPNVHYYIRNLWQIEPELVVDNYQEYYQIIEDLKKEFPNVIRTIDSELMITDKWTPGFKNILK